MAENHPNLFLVNDRDFEECVLRPPPGGLQHSIERLLAEAQAKNSIPS